MQLSKNVINLDSESRRNLHIAAVFACNFSNHMYTISEKILSESDLDFRLLLPLIDQTVMKLKDNKPSDTQTGPAKRNDPIGCSRGDSPDLDSLIAVDNESTALS